MYVFIALALAIGIILWFTLGSPDRKHDEHLARDIMVQREGLKLSRKPAKEREHIRAQGRAEATERLKACLALNPGRKVAWCSKHHHQTGSNPYA